jgi:hypothetical protein
VSFNVWRREVRRCRNLPLRAWGLIQLDYRQNGQIL